MGFHPASPRSIRTPARTAFDDADDGDDAFLIDRKSSSGSRMREGKHSQRHQIQHQQQPQQKRVSPKGNLYETPVASNTTAHSNGVSTRRKLLSEEWEAMNEGAIDDPEVLRRIIRLLRMKVSLVEDRNALLEEKNVELQQDILLAKQEGNY